MGRSHDLYVKAGSFDPVVWTVTDPVSGLPLDLTASGYTVTGAVYTSNDGTGTKLLDLLDDVVWARTNEGQIYFQPPSAVSTAWDVMSGYYQAELSHPSGESVRFDSGRFVVDVELVTD